jgi:antitoxin MazE
MSTLVKVKKWGKGMAVVIPRQFSKARKIDVGTVINLDRLRVIVPKRRRYKLAELMTGFKPSHRHGEWDMGKPVGKEIW